MGLTIQSINPEFSTTAQITVLDLAEAKALGYKTIINNRPDFEGGAEQPESKQLAEEAEKLGLTYVHLPVIPNQFTPEQIAKMGEVVAHVQKPILAFCRTGNRAGQLYLASQA